MDILLQEDSSSATCSASSAVSESLTSGSHGNGTSGSQTGKFNTSAGLQFCFCYSSASVTVLFASPHHCDIDIDLTSVCHLQGAVRQAIAASTLAVWTPQRKIRKRQDVHFQLGNLL